MHLYRPALRTIRNNLFHRQTCSVEFERGIDHQWCWRNRVSWRVDVIFLFLNWAKEFFPKTRWCRAIRNLVTFETRRVRHQTVESSLVFRERYFFFVFLTFVFRLITPSTSPMLFQDCRKVLLLFLHFDIPLQNGEYNLVSYQDFCLLRCTN